MTSLKILVSACILMYVVSISDQRPTANQLAEEGTRFNKTFSNVLLIKLLY